MPLETVSRTSFTFRSDIPSSSNRTEHKCGILHTLKHAYAHHDREEHAFAWLDDKTHENVELVISQLVQFGFNEKKMLFIPFSSKDNWMHRYPHACPYMECDDEGVIKGMPCFQQCINNGSNNAAIQNASTNTTSNRPTKKRKRSKSNTSKLIQSATLFDTERSQLHIEIYNYISWLYCQILELEKMEGGRAHVRRAGILVPGVQNLMTKLESTFKNVRELKTREDGRKRNKDGEEAADDGDNNHEVNGNTKNDNEGATASSDSEKKNAAPPTTPMPLLEECLELELRRVTDLRRVVEETQKDIDTAAQEQVSYESEKYDFEIMFERLLAYKQQKGHFDIGYHYKDGACGLGQWVNKIRRRKKELRAQELECEPPDGNSDFVSLPISPGKLGLTLQFYKSGVGAVITSIDPACTFKDQIEVGDRLVTIDGEFVSKVEDLAQGNDENVRMFGIAKKKPHYNTYLSLERVERLESIGFIWVGVFVREKRPWDEWLSLLKQYKETHGKWPSRNEKWENLGEWIHMQRRNYVRKDKNFMANRAPKLDEIGFPFVMRKFSQSVSWEDNVQKLAEFHRVNRHFNVPRPEGGSGDIDKEGLDFYKWALTLRTWYRAYQDGNGKYTRLNEDRIIELIELGFEFEDGSAPNKKEKAVPDIAFEKRVEQLQKFYDEIGHMNIDYRYKYWDNFGGWAAEISKQYKDWQEGNETISPLVEHQFNELRALGFEFNVSPKFSKRSWEENFEVFLLYKQVHGHAQVPHKYKADVRLAKWVSIQRLEYKLVCEGKASKLTKERHDKLENAGFLWDAKTRKSTD